MSNDRKRLPGSEKLTRPEDISALSKYLGDIKKVQEEHTLLDKDNLEVPGRTTGRIPEVNELPEGKETLDGVDKNRSLDETRIDLEDNRSLPLEDFVSTLDADNDPSLDNRRIDLEGNQEIKELENTREDLEPGEEIGLEKERVDIDDAKKEPNLENKRLGIETAPQDIALSDYIESLDDGGGDIKIAEEKVGLGNVSVDNELSDIKIDLENVSKDPELSTVREDIEDTQEASLSGTKIGLDNVKEDPELSETKIDLNVESEINLDDTKIDLEVESEARLDDTKLDLDIQDNSELNDTKIDLAVESENELDDTKVGLDVVEDNSLGDTKVNLEVSSDPELSETKIDLNVDSEINLDDTKIDLGVEDNNELDDTKIDLEVESEVNLDDTKISRGGEDKDLSLTDFLDSLEDDSEPELSDKRLDIESKEVSSLYDSVISGPEAKEVELGDTRLELERKETEELEDTKLSIEDIQGVEELYDGVLEAPENPEHPGWSKKELYDSIMMAPDDQKYEKALQMAQSLGPWGMKVASLISSVLSNDSVNAETATWFDAELKKILRQMGAMSQFTFEQSGEKAQNINGDSAELEDSGNREVLPSRVKKAGNTNTFNEELETTEDPEFLQHYAEGQGVSRPLGVDENADGINDKEAEAAEAFSASDKPNYVFGKWGYGGETRNRGYKTIPKYQLPSRGLLDALNVSNYLRFGVEELFSLWDPHTKAERVLKPMLLNESLALLVLAREQLEKLTKANRERLPGDGMGLISDVMSGGVSGAVGNLKDNAMSALQNTFAGVNGVDKTNPLNRPRTKLRSNGGVVTWVKEVTKGFDKGNTRQDSPGDGSMDWKNLGKNLVNALIGGLANTGDRDISFSDEYIKNYGTLLTLSDLCELSDPGEVNSLEVLKELLKKSNYITTPDKFGTIEEGRYGTMTLDTNSYWEVIIEPFCHKSMNGGISFLPSFEEINLMNYANFGVLTKYSKWIPIVNFELQKSKLTNKSLGLYDGEIVYPITSELSNELRMTVVDDQYKSWRNYFQKCADVSVYSSTSHSYEFYNKTTLDSTLKSLREDGINNKLNYTSNEQITLVDKTRPLVALYKNITFLIKIYILTPQYSTIRRFNLLCVLKDFEESYSGDIDAGGYDLNLSFSIVGENPPKDESNPIKPKKSSLNEKVGTKEQREMLNQTPKKKGGLIKLL